MSTVKVIIKNVVEFEVDGEPSNFDLAQCAELAKRAMMETPQSALVNEAKYKVKVIK